MPNEYNISFCPLCLPFTPRSAIFQGIDQDPKRAYKAVISTAAPLRHTPSSISRRNSRAGRDVPRRVRERFAREFGTRSVVCA